MHQVDKSNGKSSSTVLKYLFYGLEAKQLQSNHDYIHFNKSDAIALYLQTKYFITQQIKKYRKISYQDTPKILGFEITNEIIWNSYEVESNRIIKK